MLYDEPFVRLDGTTNSLLAVSPEVNTKAYHDAFLAMPLPKHVAESVYVQAGRILQKATGKDEEYLVAIDARTGTVVADNLDRPGQLHSTTFEGRELEAVEAHMQGLITVHNHPRSLGPSYRDVITASRNHAVVASVVLAHDGSVWYVSASSRNVADVLERSYNLSKEAYGERAEFHALDVLVERARKVGLIWMKLR